MPTIFLPQANLEQLGRARLIANLNPALFSDSSVTRHLTHPALPTSKRICSCLNDLSPAEYCRQNTQRFQCSLLLRNTEMCKRGLG